MVYVTRDEDVFEGTDHAQTTVTMTYERACLAVVPVWLTRLYGCAYIEGIHNSATNALEIRCSTDTALAVLAHVGRVEGASFLPDGGWTLIPVCAQHARLTRFALSVTMKAYGSRVSTPPTTFKTELLVFPYPVNQLGSDLGHSQWKAFYSLPHDSWTSRCGGVPQERIEAITRSAQHPDASVAPPRYMCEGEK